MGRFKRIFLALLALGVFLLVYSLQIEPQWLEVKTYPTTLTHLDPAFNDFKLVQLSDFHMRLLHPRLRHKVIEQLEEQQPELIVLTGDFVTKGDDMARVRVELERFLQEIRAIAPTIAILGNHDYWVNPLVVQRILRLSDIQTLSNGVYEVSRPKASLYFGGVDDVWEGRDRLDQVIDRLPAEGCAILLAHEPDFADTAAATGRFDLQLSGHSHAGQIRLFKPIVLPPLSHKYPVGWYQVGTMGQYTNRGLGMTKVPFRFGSRPEMTVFTLQAPG